MACRPPTDEDEGTGADEDAEGSHARCTRGDKIQGVVRRSCLSVKRQLWLCCGKRAHVWAGGVRSPEKVKACSDPTSSSSSRSPVPWPPVEHKDRRDDGVAARQLSPRLLASRLSSPWMMAYPLPISARPEDFDSGLANYEGSSMFSAYLRDSAFEHAPGPSDTIPSEDTLFLSYVNAEQELSDN
ncbi:hypothetical protein L227DRAFT_96547 [Lentinus tigrinus ALCF2SS1-6]|uniref:Uncharacterized protein n=1 Tax=Lentinus tigrinus ALCF2SS1-6 TaxID=1328759 RepID=A0A5C2S940_9APHY|nr:hypothetical protein L227DRAFT_96547 [Lentinus tigrinus ALCF2SS1-6]